LDLFGIWVLKIGDYRDMCLAIPGKVKKIEGLRAEVEYGLKVSSAENQKLKIGEHDRNKAVELREALVGEEEVEVGNWVMVQMGVVVRVLKEEEAKEMLGAWAQ
jgi:hydrogenase maturation factor